MNPIRKIYLAVFIWILLTGAVFGFVTPKLSKELVDMRNSHESQINKLQDLKEQVQALKKIQEDLTKVDVQPIKPTDMFTSDIRLVNEIKTIESFAQKSSLVETLAINGTADKAVNVQSASGLSQVPYSITLKGTFPNAVTFLKYLENAYFISPVNSLGFSRALDGTVTTNVLTNFYLYK